MQFKTRVFLDSGVLVNLLASGCPDAICTEGPFQYAVAEGVLVQPIPLWKPSEDDDGQFETPQALAAAPQMVNAGELIATGAVTAFSFESCIVPFVNFAVHLSDNQAKAAALAHSCSAHLATDDRKMRRTLRDLKVGVPLHSTTEIIREWQLASRRTDEEVRSVVQTIATRAQFWPPDDDPMAGWWHQFLS